MTSVIRKVSIGHDYRNCMNYVVGQRVLKTYLIHLIKKNSSGEVEIFNCFGVLFGIECCIVVFSGLGGRERGWTRVLGALEGG